MGSYNRRSQKANLGDHTAALENLKQSCRLEREEKNAELCIPEAMEYASTYGLLQ